VPTPDDPNYHFSEDLTTKTIAYVREQKAMTLDKPFFVYLSYGAVHAPHSVGKEWMEKYRGKFDAGWDKQRRVASAGLRRWRRDGAPHNPFIMETAP
jgi:arylsulfatase A-like enzyme